jgi:hypothetical protein
MSYKYEQIASSPRAFKILSLLCEGSSMRSVPRLVDISINTVTRELVLAGEACELLVSWFVGSRDADAAYQFISDLASRLANCVQLTADGHRAYLEAVDMAFSRAIDYAMLVKIYGTSPEGEKRYSLAVRLGTDRMVIRGDPDPDHISTSYVERANLTMRMSMRRFTRLTNAFSKKFKTHCHMIALYAFWYNFVRIHKTLRVTPAMQAGVTDHLWTLEDAVKMTHELETTNKRVP